MPADPDQTATIVTSWAIRAGREGDFDEWVEELSHLACTARGYRAAIRLGQTAGFQHLMFRFDDGETGEAWQADEAGTVAPIFTVAVERVTWTVDSGEAI